jgi:hypothetical protein
VEGVPAAFEEAVAELAFLEFFISNFCEIEGVVEFPLLFFMFVC